MEKGRRQIVLMGAAFTPVMIEEIRCLAEPAGLEVTELDMQGDHPADALKDCEILCGHCPETLLKNAEALQWVQLTSAGVDNMAEESIYPHPGVVLTNATGVYGTSIGEHLLMGTLMLLRKAPDYARQQRERRWERIPGLRLLNGRHVTVIGTGDLGSTYARYCTALGAHVVGVNRSGHPAEPFRMVYREEELWKALIGADIVAACLPGTKETWRFIGEGVFREMEPGTLFLNVGRGSTVDERALIRALQSGHLAGAMLDVFETEPLPGDSPLWEMEHVIITPHMSGSGWDSENIQRIFDLFLDNLRRYLAGRPLRNVVDRPRGY